MSTTQKSTVSPKPTIASNPEEVEKWLAKDEAEKEAPENLSQQTDENTSQQTDNNLSQQADKKTKILANKHAIQQEDIEPTAMLSARVPASLIRKLRIQAATDGERIQDILTKLLRDYLETE